MKRIISISLILAAIFMMVGACINQVHAQSNSIYQIGLQPVCWTTPSDPVVDSNLVSYWLVSSRETTPRVISYLAADGTAVVVAGGSLKNGFCCCASASTDTLGIEINGDTLTLIQNEITYQYIGGDDDWRWVDSTSNKSMYEAIYRLGKASIFTEDTTHAFRVDSTFQFRTDGGKAIFDWLRGDSLVTFKTWMFRAPGGATGFPQNDGNSITIARTNATTTRTNLGNIKFAAPYTGGGGAYRVGAMISALDETGGNDTTGVVLDFWTRQLGESFMRNTMTLEGDGRLELDRYNLFDDGVPERLLGYDNSARDVTVHDIEGTRQPGYLLGINSSNSALAYISGDSLGLGTNFLLAGDTGSSVITTGDTATIVGGYAINTVGGSDDVIVTVDTVDLANIFTKGSTPNGLFTPGSVLFANSLGRIAQNNPLFFWDNPNGRLGLGTNTPSALLHMVTNGTGPNTSVLQEVFSSVVSTDRPVYAGRRARGTSLVPVSLLNGDLVFSFLSAGYAGSFVNAAAIDFSVSGTVSSGIVPIDITMSTGSNGVRVPRMTIKSIGNIGVNEIAPSSTFDINGTLEVVTRTGTATSIGGWTAGNVATNVTVGTGLSLSGGTLTNTVSDTWLKPQLEAGNVTIFSNLNSLFLSDNPGDAVTTISNTLIDIANNDTGDGVTIDVTGINAQTDYIFSSLEGLDITAENTVQVTSNTGNVNISSFDSANIESLTNDVSVSAALNTTIDAGGGILLNAGSNVEATADNFNVITSSSATFSVDQSFIVNSGKATIASQDTMTIDVEVLSRTNASATQFIERTPVSATGYATELPTNAPLDNSVRLYQADETSAFVALPTSIYGQLSFSNATPFADSIELVSLVPDPGTGNYVIEFPTGLVQGLTRTDSSFIVPTSTFYQFTYTVTYWQDGVAGEIFGAYVDVDGGFTPLSINQQTKPTAVANISAVQTLSHSCILSINTVTPARLGLFGSSGVTVLNAVFTIKQL